MVKVSDPKGRRSLSTWMSEVRIYKWLLECPAGT